LPALGSHLLPRGPLLALLALFFLTDPLEPPLAGMERTVAGR
jgi:hypothetical protein